MCVRGAIIAELQYINTWSSYLSPPSTHTGTLPPWCEFNSLKGISGRVWVKHKNFMLLPKASNLWMNFSLQSPVPDLTVTPNVHDGRFHIKQWILIKDVSLMTDVNVLIQDIGPYRTNSWVEWCNKVTMTTQPCINLWKIGPSGSLINKLRSQLRRLMTGGQNTPLAPDIFHWNSFHLFLQVSTWTF